MTLAELKIRISEYQYMEDDHFIDAALACVVATRLNRNDPLWLILIAPSSSGKTQVLRPLAMTDPKFIHSIDDLTENTFLSGAKMSKNDRAPMSLLQRIGSLGMIVISDLTGLFSKPSESRSNILGQLRMIYDGEFTKYVGSQSAPISWKGDISILAGSTPSIYKHFEEFASFGERFIYYRLHDYNRINAARVMVKRKKEKTMNDTLAGLYGDYIKEVVVGAGKKEELPEETVNRIIDVASTVELLRVAGSFDFKSDYLTEIPTPAMPMRTVGQLLTLADGLLVMKRHDSDGKVGLEENELKTIEWCGYSLVNDQRRACLKVLAAVGDDVYLSTSKIGDISGIPTNVVRMVMQIYTAIKVVERTGDSQGLSWKLADKKVKEVIRRVERIDEDTVVEDRKTSSEEKDEAEKASNQAFDEFTLHG